MNLTGGHQTDAGTQHTVDIETQVCKRGYVHVGPNNTAFK